MSMIKYRVHEVAKDFGMPTKAVTQILTDYVATPKNHMQVLETPELDVIFEYITQHHQVESLEEIFIPPAKQRLFFRRFLRALSLRFQDRTPRRLPR